MRAVPILLAALALLGGCGTKATTVGGQARTKQYASVVSLSPSATEIFGGLGATGILKGRTAACDYPEYFVRSVPVVAQVKPDYESIAAIKPDLVVYDADLYNEADIAKIKELGAETIALDAPDPKRLEAQVQSLATKLGFETAASTYVDKIEVARQVNAANPPPRPVKAAVLLSGGMAAGTESFLAAAMKDSGATLVGPSGTKFAALDAEAMIAAAPDVIFVPVDKTDPAGATRAVAAVEKDPRLATLPAIRNKKVIPFDDDVLLRKGYRVDKLLDGLHTAILKQ